MGFGIKKWIQTNRNLAIIAGCLVMLIAVSASVMVVVFGDDALDTIGISQSSSEESGDDEEPESTSDKMEKPEQSLEDSFAGQLYKAKAEADKLAVLEEYANNRDADWNSSSLRNLFLSGKTEAVRTKAFHISRQLATIDGHEAVVSVHRQGIGSIYDDVKREAISACRKTPKVELLDDLLEVAEEDSTNRHLAVQALAFMDSSEAQRKVLESAKSEEISEAERIQAILLLSRTDLTEAIGYLQELTIAEDAQYRKYALESLDAIQERRARNR